MSKQEIAIDLFRQGYNCAQAVLLAFCEDFGLSRQVAAKVALPFGGGMGQMRETCGALTGAFMVLGLVDKAPVPPSSLEKAACYEKVRAFAEVFRRENGAILCRELLALNQNGERKKTCALLVGKTAELLEEFLQPLLQESETGK